MGTNMPYCMHIYNNAQLTKLTSIKDFRINIETKPREEKCETYSMGTSMPHDMDVPADQQTARKK